MLVMIFKLSKPFLRFYCLRHEQNFTIHQQKVKISALYQFLIKTVWSQNWTRPGSDNKNNMLILKNDIRGFGKFRFFYQCDVILR